MEVSVSRRHTEISESLRLVAEEKIGRLGRFVEGLEFAEVHFSEHKNPRIVDKEVCEVTISGHGHHVRCKVQAPDGFIAIDRAYAKLEHQLHKLKTKLTQRHHGQPKARKGVDGLAATILVEAPEAVADAEADGQVEPRIVKSKRFAIHPMSADEAVERMVLLGHGFFFFTNVETSRAAVVYVRDDGDVGLIDEAD
ncbi:MAG: raiA [Acidimicrobiales bacterium]|nr:raiA [Acidimicrobiales bacterium]